MATTEELLERIDRRLQTLVAISAGTASEGLTQKELVERLAGLGLDARTISEATGVPSSTVSPIVSRSRRGTTPAAKTPRKRK